MNDKSITEEKMADSFEKLLCDKNGISEFPSFHSIFREIRCQQGIADFIAIENNVLKNEIWKLPERINKISNISVFHIISLLKPKAPRTETFLTRNTGLSLKTVKRILKQLEYQQIIKRLDSGGIIVGPKWKSPNFDLWAFELKLNNWKRALFQASQYRTFATNITVVFPTERKKTIIENLNKFRKMKIGVMLFDISKNNYEIILKPNKIKSTSKRFYFHTIGTLMTMKDLCSLNVAESKKGLYKRIKGITIKNFNKILRLFIFNLKKKLFSLL